MTRSMAGYAATCTSLLLVACLAITGCATQSASDSALNDAEATANIQLIRAHFERFNDHDAEGVGALSTDDVAWYSVAGDEVVVNSTGVEQLESSLREYFEALPSVRAELEHVHASGSYAFARERVAWVNRDGEKRSQAAYSCYHIVDGKINAVWYFPAE